LPVPDIAIFLQGKVQFAKFNEYVFTYAIDKLSVHTVCSATLAVERHHPFVDCCILNACTPNG